MGVASRRPKTIDAARLARSAPWAPLDVVADAAGVTETGMHNKLVSLPGRGVCAEGARRLSLSRSPMTDKRLSGAASRWCPPGAARAAVCDDDIDFVEKMAGAAAGPAVWQARVEHPYAYRIDEFDDSDLSVVGYGNDEPLAGTPLSVLRGGAPEMWNNPACPPTVITASVVEYTEPEVYLYGHQVAMQTAAASNPRCCAGTVAVLATSRYDKTRAAAASNPSCPPAVIGSLADDIDRGVRLALAANPSCPPEVLHQMISQKDFTLRAAAASNPALAAATLTEMAQSSDPKLCAAAARHPNCPPRWVEHLAGSSSRAARAAAAANPALNPTRVAELATGGDAATRAAALTHPDCPADAVAAGCADRSPKVRAAAIVHPLCPPDAIGYAAVNSQPDAPDVARAALKHPDCPQWALRIAAGSDNKKCAKAAVSHPLCPSETLDKVVRQAITGSDISNRVARAALRHPSLPARNAHRRSGLQQRQPGLRRVEASGLPARNAHRRRGRS